MGRHDLQVSAKRRDVIIPDVMDARPSQTGARLPDKGGRGGFSEADWGEMGKTSVTGAIEIARLVVSARRDIETINANADAEVRKIGAEIERITASAKMDIEKIKAESEAWNSRFDRESAERRKIVDKVMDSLVEHPEWSDEIKAKVIDLAIAQIPLK